MANPFEKRATEFLRDDEAGFLSLVSPEPLTAYLDNAKTRQKLYDRLVQIVGAPGSGKTTMATLVETRMVETVLAERQKQEHGAIIKALSACGIVERGRPAVAAVRLPMEGEYRDFWELPYDEGLRTRLVLALVQARMVLGVVRNFERRRDKSTIRFRLRPDAGAALQEIGGERTEDIVARAAAVERAVYSVGAALVPPRAEAIPDDAARPYRPLDVIEGVEIDERDGTTQKLRLLMILDDAHTLAAEQFKLIFRDLARREIRIARWIMMRLDNLNPAITLVEDERRLAPGVAEGRDFMTVSLQNGKGGERSRATFRSFARNMADRYLQQHPVLRRQQWRDFSTLLSSEPPRISEANLRKLTEEVDRTQARLGVAQSRREMLKEEIENFVSGGQNSTRPDVGQEVQLAMLRILMNRYVNRIPQGSLFEDEADPDPRMPVAANAGVANGARLQLRHQFQRPLHYGIDTISDASSENAELFLQLAAGLVNRMEARLINGDQPLLSPDQQDRILGERAKEIMVGWNFPFAGRIRAMLASIAEDCVAESRTPNARLGAGANAIGIPQKEFEELLLDGQSDIVQLLHYAAAYNAIVVRPNYHQGKKIWCLIELGGPAILANSLTLVRGGFLERRKEDLIRYAKEAS